MGTVFKARDLRREEAQDRHPYVAVKTLNIDVLQRDDSLKILQREARKAQGLAHPNIVRVHDFDRDGSTLFLTMELLEGTSLDAILQKNGLRGARLTALLPILRQIVSALQFAHSEGIVHSDLKPANIIVLPNGRVKVIDFGISRAIPNPNQLTSEQTTFDVKALGAMTPAYASPEMFDGADPDPRDDVFALACIIYELLTGRHPFGQAPASVARAGNYIPQQPADLSPTQWRALQAGLHFDRAKRAASAEQLLSGLAPQAAIRSGHRWTSAGTALGLLMALGLGGYFAVNGDISGPRFGPRPQTKLATSSGAPEQPASNSSATSEAAQQKAAEEAAQRLAQQNAATERRRGRHSRGGGGSGAEAGAAEGGGGSRAEAGAAEGGGGSGAEVGAAEGGGGSGAEAGAAEGGGGSGAEAGAAEGGGGSGAEAGAAEGGGGSGAEAGAAEGGGGSAQRQAQQRAAEEAAQRQAQQRAAGAAGRRSRGRQRGGAGGAASCSPQLPPDQVGPSQIAEAQRLLTSMGLNTGVANGKMGPRTQEMVRAFQWSIGMPPTGELTMALLETLRGKAPPVAARAKSLFTLAAEARNARRPGDATRLYEAALKLAPNDADGLLALGDLRRDANDLEAARRAYETLASGHGAAAGIARERLAGLPMQQPPSNAQTHGRCCIPGGSFARPDNSRPTAQATHQRRSTPGDRDRVPVVGTPTHLDPTRPFDGTYTGVRQITGFSNPGCRPTLPTTITVRDGRLSFLKEYRDDHFAGWILQ